MGLTTFPLRCRPHAQHCKAPAAGTRFRAPRVHERQTTTATTSSSKKFTSSSTCSSDKGALSCTAHMTPRRSPLYHGWTCTTGRSSLTQSDWRCTSYPMARRWWFLWYTRPQPPLRLLMPEDPETYSLHDSTGLLQTHRCCSCKRCAQKLRCSWRTGCSSCHRLTHACRIITLVIHVAEHRMMRCFGTAMGCVRRECHSQQQKQLACQTQQIIIILASRAPTTMNIHTCPSADRTRQQHYS
jgi:hypothetical protein